jgi:hypothetical protein
MSDFDIDLLSQMFPVWLSRSLLAGTVYEVDQLVHAVDAVLRCGASATVPTVTVIPRQAAEATSIEDLTQLGGIPWRHLWRAGGPSLIEPSLSCMISMSNHQDHQLSSRSSCSIPSDLGESP